MFVRPINRFLALSLRDRILFVKVWVLLCCVALLLRLLDYQRTRRLLERLSSSPAGQGNTTEDGMAYALRLGALARIAGRYVPTNGTCLRQALLVWWLLRRKALPAELRIGVQKHPAFVAHAWVELDGMPVNDDFDVEKRLAPLVGLSPSSRIQ